MSTRDVSLEGGKYVYRIDTRNGQLVDALRHGEHWPAGMEVAQHSKAVMAMLTRIMELEDECARAAGA